MRSEYRHIADHEKYIVDHLHRSGITGLLTCTKVSKGVLFFHQLLRRDIHPENILEDGNLFLID